MEYDVKKALKEAKEQVKNKDFSSALDTCKVSFYGLDCFKIVSM